LRGDNPSHRAKSSCAFATTYNHAFANPRGPTAAWIREYVIFPDSNPERPVTSSISSSASSSRKSLTIIQTLLIVGTAGLIGSSLLKLLM
jgi:hypothetical protein